MNTFLEVSWSLSRGRETYGYNIVRLTDFETGKRFRCMGGGYDLVGTVFGQWLEDTYQDRLLTLEEGTFATLYGFKLRDGKARLDGACGLDSMRDIAKAIGLDVKWIGTQRGRTIGYMVTDTREESA